MNILFCGDVVGRSGKKVIKENLPQIKKKYNINFTIINCDNASGGFGVNKKTVNELIDLGADVLTGGDHIWDHKEINSLISESKQLLRPHNFPESCPGVGARIYNISAHQKIMVIHLMGQIFTKYQVDCPFACVSRILESNKLKQGIDAIFVDFHGEATSEKMAMGQFLDGKVSAVIGTHTHVPTSDDHIMQKGTAYQTDCGMCGDYNSVIGMKKEIPLMIFNQKRKFSGMDPASGDATLCASIIEIESTTGLAKNITPIRLGGILSQT